MTNKKHKHEPTEEPQEQTMPEEQFQMDIESVIKRAEEAEVLAAEHRDGWQRAQADFVNYKSRVARDYDMMRATMKGDLLKKVLPVLDDLERALREAGRPADDAWASGIELVARKFQAIIESEGATRIEAVGLPFDPNLHEAISHEPSQDVPSEHVIAVVQNGYMLGERVIRPALVRVAQ